MLSSTPPLPITHDGDETEHQNASQSNSNRSSHTHQSPKMTSVYNGRRKSSLSYQQQLQLVTAVGVDGIIGSCGNSLGDANSSCVSPNPYNQHTNEPFMHHHHQHPKLSIHQIDRYDDTLTCCLPPPSPAPTSDRFVMGMSTLTTAASTSSNHYSIFETTPVATSTLQSNPQTLVSPSSASTASTASSGNGKINGSQQHQNVSLTGTNTAGLMLSQKYSSTNSVSTLQRSLSPNSRFRISDRFREKPSATSSSSSSSRFASSTHFLTQNSPLVPSDAYSYFSSAVHTPVKRYVPTPPPPSELFVDMPMSLQQQQQPLPPAESGSKISSMHQQLPHSAQQQPHQHSTNINTLPYRLRMKCCANETSQQQQISAYLPVSHTQTHHHDQRSNNLPPVDYYATSPRTRLSSSGNIGASSVNSSTGKDSPLVMLHELQLPNVRAKSCSSSAASSSASSSASLASSSGASPITVDGVGGACSRQPTTLRSSTNCMVNDFVSRTPSIEYINTSQATNSGGVVGRVMTPVSLLSGIDTASNASVSTGTCLHCKTMRRTTGVHQTTQTTGPISPVPLQQLPSNSMYSNSSSTRNNLELTPSTSTPSTSESHISPLSPATVLQQQKLQQQQKIELEKMVVEQRDQDYQKQQQQQQQQQQIYQHHYQQQQQQQQQRHHQRQLVTTQNNLLERNNIINTQQQQLPVETRAQQQQQQQPTHYHQQSSQQIQQSHQSLPMQQQLQLQQRYSRKQRISQYVRKEIANFFGVDAQSEAEERAKWYGRQRRLALRRFGVLRSENDISFTGNEGDVNAGYLSESGTRSHQRNGMHAGQGSSHQHASERPDILPAQDAENNEMQIAGRKRANSRRRHFINTDFQIGDHVERKASVPSMFVSGLTYIIQMLNKRQLRKRCQWSRSFAPSHITNLNGGENPSNVCEGLTALQEEEVFFDSPGNDQNNVGGVASAASAMSISPANGIRNATTSNAKIIEHHRQLYMGERVQGWRTSAIVGSIHAADMPAPTLQHQQQLVAAAVQQQQPSQQHQPAQHHQNGTRGNRIASQILDGVLENSRRPLAKRVKLFSINDLDDRHDHRPFFTYWINTVQILVLFLSLICYGIGPIGFGVEQKTGQVLVTSLSLQTVQHQEQRNVWIGPRNSDLVHMGAKFATCMRRDIKIMDVLVKTRRQERETACCIRNDDSGCVQSSQADCSVRGLFPTKSISTWKKWSPGESGPGGRISGSVCGLDPKYCDAPASIAPYEWPDDITKWPICRKTNSFSQRFRYKDHTAEHMVCEVIGHPCCTGVFGECRITTREYCDFVNGYFHEEASLCSQISCLNNVCGMFPFFSIEVPDQFYRLFTSLCLHAGILHLAITVAFQHVFLADLERLIGPIRTAIVYIGSGLAGNLTSAVLVPYKPEVGPLASLSGVVASLVVLLILMHWKQLHKPHVALFKLIFIGGILFGIGTLPWQLNFAGLLAGIFCGIFLTIALVPFVSVAKYGRKSKINLIWSCILFHLFVYTVMLIIFYIFPTEFTNLNFGEVLNGGGSNSNSADLGSMGGIESFSNNVMTSSSNNHRQQLQQQYHHHHHSDDIIGNNALNGGVSSNAAHLLQSSSQSQIYFNHNFHSSRITTSNNNNNNNNNNNIVTSNILIYESSNHNFFIKNNNTINNKNKSLAYYNLYKSNDMRSNNINNNSNNASYNNEKGNMYQLNNNNNIALNNKNYYNINNNSNNNRNSNIRYLSNGINSNTSNMTTPLQQLVLKKNNNNRITNNNNNNQQQTISKLNKNLENQSYQRKNKQPNIAAVREKSALYFVDAVSPPLKQLLSPPYTSSNNDTRLEQEQAAAVSGAL